MSSDHAPLRSRQVVVKTEALSSGAMVTASHPLAAEAGIEVIVSAGGNAADAAIATALASGVVEPFMSGLGGCAYAVAFDARAGTTRSFDGSAAAPLAAREDLFELAGADEPRKGLYGWRATRNDASETGHRSIGVPGALAALDRLHAFLGSLPWSELIVPARRLAKDGFPVDEHFFVQSAASESRLRAFPETLDVFFRPDGTARPPEMQGAEPARLHQPALASALELLGREGPRAFYRGEAAAGIVSFVRERGGLLGLEDLASYAPREGEPLRTRYRGRRVDVLPGASGGPTIALALAILAGIDLPRYEPADPSRLHVVAEALRLAFGDRFRFLADPDTEAVPIAALVSADYARERRAHLSPDGRRAPELPEGDPWRHAPGAPREPRPGSADAPDQHTTHLNVVDRERNMVALTATLGARFGSGVTVPALGVVLNNGMMWFDPEPSHLNSIRPGKRALHAAAPCLLFDEAAGRRLALGAPGARRIMSAVLQVLLHVVDHGLGIQDAILAPRIHCEAEGALVVDERFGDGVVQALADRGHRLEVTSEGFLVSRFGRPSGILVDHGAGTLHGGVEPHRTGTAIGC